MTNQELVKSNGNGTQSTQNTQNQLAIRRQEEQALPQLWQEMNQWMNNWNSLFDSFFNRAGSWGFPASGLSRWLEPSFGFGSRLSSFVPAVNVSETGRELQITAELPGLDEQDVEVTLNRDSLTIRGEKRNEFEDKGRDYYRMERSYGSFHRTIPLPGEVDTEKVDARFNKGVLTVTLPKLPEHRLGSRKIQIKTEGR